MEYANDVRKMAFFLEQESNINKGNEKARSSVENNRINQMLKI